MPKKATEEEPTYGSEETPEGFIPIPEVETVEPPEEVQTPEETPEEVPEELPEKPEEIPEEKPTETPETPEEKPTFQFVDDKPADDTKPYEVIKHLGKEVEVATKEDGRNLMQKGYDYEQKVGRHGKLAQTLDQHPEFAERVAKEWENFVGEKTTPKEPEKPELKGLDQYEDPNVWFWENYEKIREHEEANKPAPEPVTSDAELLLKTTLATHDPQNVARIAPLVPQYAEKFLTKEQYDRIDNDLPSLIQFYDFVKGQVDKSTKPKQDLPPTPAFRVKSGGGEAPGAAPEKPPWETKNNEEFEQYLASVKGIASY